MRVIGEPHLAVFGIAEADVQRLIEEEHVSLWSQITLVQPTQQVTTHPLVPGVGVDLGIVGCLGVLLDRARS